MELQFTFNRTILELKYSPSFLIDNFWVLLIVQYLNWNVFAAWVESADGTLLIVQYLNWNSRKVSFWSVSPMAFNRTILELKYFIGNFYRKANWLLIVQYLNWNKPAFQRSVREKSLLIVQYLNWNDCISLSHWCHSALLIVQYLNWNSQQDWHNGILPAFNRTILELKFEETTSIDANLKNF